MSKSGGPLSHFRQKPDDKRSINTVNAFAGEMMGKVFVAKYFPAESKEDMKRMITETIEIMDVSIQENDWLTAYAALSHAGVLLCCGQIGDLLYVYCPIHRQVHTSAAPAAG